MQRFRNIAAALSVVAVAGGVTVGFMTEAASGSAAPKSSIFGKPDPATKAPWVFAMIDLVGGPVAFPEAEQGAQAAIDYVNAYRGGIDGHKIVLKTCANATLTAASSQNCANQLLADHPFLILGGADTGGAGSFPIWESHHLAYIGGSPFTPVEGNAPNSDIFVGFSGADNVAAMNYAATKLHAKSVAIIEADDPQGIAVANAIAAAAKANKMKTTQVPLSDTATASDYSAAAAQAEASHPGLMYLEAPNECPQVVLALRQTGYHGKLGGIGPCTSPAALKAMGSAGNGLFTPSPFVDFDQVGTRQWGPEIKLTEAIFAKYAPKDVLDEIALASFAPVMNLRATIPTIKGKVDEASILKAFATGSNHPNWLAHPYTCNRKQDPADKSICEAYNLMEKVQNGKLVTLSGWINGAS